MSRCCVTGTCVASWIIAFNEGTGSCFCVLDHADLTAPHLFLHIEMIDFTIKSLYRYLDS